MKRPVIMVVIVLAVVMVLIGGAVVADRGAKATAENTITNAVRDAVPGATGISTSVSGIPVATQLARGSLSHVTVSMLTLPANGVVLDDVIVDVTQVTTTAPYRAQDVEATASIPTAALQSKLGDGWSLRTDGTAIVASLTSIPGAQARIVPSVNSGALALTLDSVTIFGAQIDGSLVPKAVTDKLDELARSVAGLPFGLTLASVKVTPAGVDLVATGHDVTLEQG